MVLKLGCPNCSKVYRLNEPLPPEGKKYRCTCGTVLVVTYPESVRKVLSSRGVAVLDDDGGEPGAPPRPPPVGAGDDAAFRQRHGRPAQDRLPARRRGLPEDLKQTIPASSPTARATSGAASGDAAGAAKPRRTVAGDLPEDPSIEMRPPRPRTRADEVPTADPEDDEPTADEHPRPTGGDAPPEPRAPATPPEPRAPATPPEPRAPATPPEPLTPPAPPEPLAAPAPRTSLSDALTPPTPPEPLAAPATEEAPSEPLTPTAPPEPLAPTPPSAPSLTPPPMTPALERDEAAPRLTDPPEECTPSPALPAAGTAEGAAGDPGASTSPAADRTEVRDDAGGGGAISARRHARSGAASGRAAFGRAASGYGVGGTTSAGRDRPSAARPGPTTARRGLARRLLGSRLLKITAAAALLLVLAGVGAVVGVIAYYSRDLPSVEALRDYRPPIVTRIYAADGQLIGEAYEKQRYVVPYTQMPEDLVYAFVAAEDAQFFEHHGIDYMGIVRAMIRNIESGEFSQGASTITQQVARSFLLTREKKISRKIKEAILAYRIEKNFSKEYILYLYLNQIFLGHGAYGVEAASQLYFGKHVEDLSLAEAAIIAGLPQAPSRYSPNNSYSSAKARQRYTLDQMADVGFITQAEADAAYEQPLVFQRKRDKNLDVGPYFVEHVRRYLVDRYGHDAVYLDGMTVYTTMDPELQRAANQALQRGVRVVDHRVGLYEPFQHLEPDAVAAELSAIDLERYLASLPYDPSREEPTTVPAGSVPPLVEDELTRGVVSEVHDQYVWVDVGSIRGILHHADGKWAYDVNPQAHVRWRQIASMRDAYHPGDVITVRVVNPEESWRKTLGRDAVHPRLALDQEPQVEGALLSMRLRDGAVLAMVGGYDYVKSEFNRATQANRQVGSTFKPLVYASALDCNRHPDTRKCGAEDKDITFTPSTIIVESPIVGFKPRRDGGVEAWKPANADGEFMGDITMRRALVLSRNIVTLKIAQAVGVNYLYEYIQRFGFDTELEPNLALALGAGCLTLEEMVRAYSVFANLGDRQGPYYIRQVLDRDGQVLEETAHGERVEDVMDEVTAYQMVRLMRDVVSSGTATKALVLGVPLQGKTGTTNDYKDAWFMGYNAQIVTGVWVGFDDFNRSLGRGQYGGDCALPIWIDYMRAALEKYPETAFTRPPGVEVVQVDPETGLLVGEAGGGVAVAFRVNTAPTSYAQAEGEVDSSEFLTSDGGL